MNVTQPYERPCLGCQAPVRAKSFAGAVTTRYCQECRDKRSADFALDQSEARKRTQAYQRQMWLTARHGIPARFRGHSWEDFAFDRGGESNRPRVAALRKWASGLPVGIRPEGYPSLVIASPSNGVGKTLLTTLILSSVIERHDDLDREHSPYQLWTAGEIMLRLEAAERYSSAETPSDVYRDLTTLRLLMIDDVGKAHFPGGPAIRAYGMYYQIIDGRYANNLPLVLTSNLSMEPWTAGGLSLVDVMGRASVSRLMEMTGGEIYHIAGEDRR